MRGHALKGQKHIAQGNTLGYVLLGFQPALLLVIHHFSSKKSCF